MKKVLTNALVLVNSVDISNHVTQVQIQDNRTEVDVTAMGDVNNEIALGLGDATITLTVLNDYDAGSIDSQLWPLHKTNTPFPVEIRSDSAARSASNPAYTMTALLPQYNPIDGSVGAAVSTQVVLRNASQAGVGRAVS